MKFTDYDPGEYYDELFVEKSRPRPGAEILTRAIDSLSEGQLSKSQAAAELSLLNMGITFNVYDDDDGEEKIWPFDIIPRPVESSDWLAIEAGLRQRIRALNLFIDDIYHEQRVIKDGVVPEFVIKSAPGFLPSCVGLSPPRGIWCHITGSDLVRDDDGRFYVLEDNMRCPSGVSYVLENREVLKRTFPQVFDASLVRAVDDYPDRLLDMLRFLAPDNVPAPVVVLLTPGMYNSAYYEHAFLAQQMGVELVEGRDLMVVDGLVMMRTTEGPQRVDVIYRRIDDTFLDPAVFREDSMLGVPGLMEVYASGHVGIVNAPGTGVADDKVVYAYVPQIIKYYLDEDILLPNVETYVCFEEDQRNYVLENLEKLVVKPANESGGYGLMIGPHSTTAQRQEYAARIKADPRNYIAQPTISLSRTPVIVDDHFEGRHVDLRPFALYGEDIYVMPGGLTRVALQKGSLVVNSSQGGGSKDTWVLQG
jgi:uncharacterized circularly permuted ATP-grasp superfamily protein